MFGPFGNLLCVLISIMDRNNCISILIGGKEYTIMREWFIYREDLYLHTDQVITTISALEKGEVDK